MAEDWDRILACVLRPARPELERCWGVLRDLAVRRSGAAVERARTLTDLQARLSAARGEVLAAGDGVVGEAMTALEREWLQAARSGDPSSELEALWRAVAPPRWAGRPAPSSFEAIAALASDPEGVEQAERAAAELALALRPWGVTVGHAVEWNVAPVLIFAVRAEEIFSGLAAALAGVATTAELDAAERRSRAVRQALGRRAVPSRNSSVAHELGVLCRLDALGNAAGSRLAEPARPVAPALRLWSLGYALTACDGSGVVLTALPVSASLDADSAA